MLMVVRLVAALRFLPPLPVGLQVVDELGPLLRGQRGVELIEHRERHLVQPLSLRRELLIVTSTFARSILPAATPSASVFAKSFPAARDGSILETSSARHLFDGGLLIGGEVEVFDAHDDEPE